MFRFLHTSDLHLGKPFGTFEEDVRADLRKARAEVVSKLAEAARECAVSHILLAGDTFDQEAPSLRLIRHTITAMAEAAEVQWWLLPGNHDSLTAELIWQTFASHPSPNIHVLHNTQSQMMADGVWLLPAPCLRRMPGYDLTAHMQSVDTPAGALRIGLAHGGVTDFSGEGANAQTIPPDRAERADLDYLALGDWHGALAVNARTHYSGAPERDRFKHTGRGICLLVSLDAPGAVPEVSQIPIGRYAWEDVALTLAPGVDALEALAQILPPTRSQWRDSLLRLTLSGRLHLEQRMALGAELQRIAPEFCFFETRDHRLHTQYHPNDLDQIARSGALRLAAEGLKAEADNPDLARTERDIADAALTRLYSMVRETTP